MNPVLYKFWQRFRSGQPESIKRLGRAVAGLRSTSQHSPQIDADLLETCKVVPSRAALISLLPKGGVVGEVGVETGSFSELILQKANPAALHLFEIDYGKTRASVLSNPKAIKHTGLSADLLRQMPDDCFDWLYIDGDHRYAGVKADCLAARSKVKPGGYLVFNDFLIVDINFGRYGVHKAVSEFIVEQRWPVRFFALAANGHYDIAIQRPSH